MFLLIKNVHIYAPKDMGVQDILICNDKIIDIAKDVSYSFPEMKVIDAFGKIAVPGFIDQHVHVLGGGGESGFKSRIREIDITEIIKAGVTTVVGLLGTDGSTRSVEALVAKTKALNEEGITAFCLTGSYEVPTVTLTDSVTKDIMYIQEIIGAKIAIADHRCSYPSADEISRLASQVRIASLLSGKPGIVCMHMGAGKAGLSDIFKVLEETDIPISHFRPTHVGRILEDAIEFAQKGGIIDFTSGAKPSKTAHAIKEVLQDLSVDHITLSSDSNGSSPVWNDKNEVVGMGVGKMDTLWETVKALIIEEKTDITTALKIITENVAKGLDIYPRKGLIANDSDADLVLLDADFNIDTVVSKGNIMYENGKLLHNGFYMYN